MLKPTVNGAIFYADTPFNYLNVSTVGNQAAVEKEAPGEKNIVVDNKTNFAVYAIGGIAIIGVIAVVLKKKKKSKDEWQ